MHTKIIYSVLYTVCHLCVREFSNKVVFWNVELEYFLVCLVGLSLFHLFASILSFLQAESAHAHKGLL